MAKKRDGRAQVLDMGDELTERAKNNFNALDFIV